MPTISAFLGIVIQMYWRDHGPPHFHARYAGYKAAIDIRSGDILYGSLPPRALALVSEWTANYRDQLLEDWELCRQMKTPNPIPPLE